MYKYYSKTIKGALNTTDSDVKECGEHAGTRRFAVRYLFFLVIDIRKFKFWLSIDKSQRGS